MFIGFGTGGFGAIDTVQTDALSKQPTGTNAGVFAGAIVKTPYLEKWGGVDIVGEFDGNGINVGLRIPLTSDYRLNLGFTHIEKLPKWKERYWKGHSAITLGFEITAPRRSASKIPGGGPTPPPMLQPGNIDMAEIRPFNGTHPKVINDWLLKDAELEFNYSPDYKITLKDRKHRIRFWLLEKMGIDISHKHYTDVKKL